MSFILYLMKVIKIVIIIINDDENINGKCNITITIATIRIVKLTVLQRYGPAAAFDIPFQAKTPLLGP